MEDKEEKGHWATIDLHSTETLQCEYCDIYLKGKNAYLYIDEGEVEKVLCPKCKREDVKR